MKMNYSAIGIGFGVTLVLGVLSGLLYAGSASAGIFGSWGVVGALGGLAAGYVVGGSMKSGAIHGGLATVVGSLVVLGLAAATTVLFGGLVVALGIIGFGGLMLAIHAIPGLIGGAAGSWLKERRSAPKVVGAKV